MDAIAIAEYTNDTILLKHPTSLLNICYAR